MYSILLHGVKQSPQKKSINNKMFCCKISNFVQSGDVFEKTFLYSKKVFRKLILHVVVYKMGFVQKEAIYLDS